MSKLKEFIEMSWDTQIACNFLKGYILLFPLSLWTFVGVSLSRAVFLRCCHVKRMVCLVQENTAKNFLLLLSWAINCSNIVASSSSSFPRTITRGLTKERKNEKAPSDRNRHLSNSVYSIPFFHTHTLSSLICAHIHTTNQQKALFV